MRYALLLAGALLSAASWGMAAESGQQPLRLGDIIVKAKNTVTSAAEKAQDPLSNALDRGAKAFQDAGDALKEHGAKVAEKSGEFVEQSGKAIQDGAKALGQYGNEAGAKIKSTLRELSAPESFPIEVSPELLAEGVKATTARRTDPPAGSAQGTDFTVAVFVTFDHPFTGRMHLRGYRADGAEIARSRLIEVMVGADAGGHYIFGFDPATDLSSVAKLTLMGKKETLPAKKKTETPGEAAGQIVKELLK